MRLDGSRVTFGKFADEWQKAREESGELAEKTLTETARQVRIMSGYIGGKPLTAINAETIERLLRNLRKDRPGQGGKPLSGRTLQAYYRTLHQIMRKACDYDYITRNPCAKVKPPRAQDPERNALTPERAAELLGRLDECEAAELEEFAAKEQRQNEWKADGGRRSIRGVSHLANLMGVRLALATGMRLGEVLGLVWAHVDLEGARLCVVQSLTDKGKTKPPKTKQGRRTIAIDPLTAGRLSAWKVFQAAQLVKIGKLPEPGADGIAPDLLDAIPVVCSDVGGFADMHNYGHWWRAWRAANGFEGLKLHELRHTQATQLLAHGVDVKTVQARLGHADPALTLKWYAHAVEENDRQAARVLADLLDGGKRPESQARDGGKCDFVRVSSERYEKQPFLEAGGKVCFPVPTCLYGYGASDRNRTRNPLITNAPLIRNVRNGNNPLFTDYQDKHTNKSIQEPTRKRKEN